MFIAQAVHILFLAPLASDMSLQCAPIGALSITNSAVYKHLAPPEQKHVSQVCYCQ
jgi:hypothetical protein